MGGEGKGELVVWLVKLAWIRKSMCQRLTADDPDYLGGSVLGGPDKPPGNRNESVVLEPFL